MAEDARHADEEEEQEVLVSRRSRQHRRKFFSRPLLLSRTLPVIIACVVQP